MAAEAVGVLQAKGNVITLCECDQNEQAQLLDQQLQQLQSEQGTLLERLQRQLTEQLSQPELYLFRIWAEALRLNCNLMNSSRDSAQG